MSTTEQERPSIVLRLLAGIVLVVGAIILLRVAFGFLAGIFWILIIVAVLIAVIWAWRTLSR
jgi:fatty acid desaturase